MIEKIKNGLLFMGLSGMFFTIWALGGEGEIESTALGMKATNPKELLRIWKRIIF